MAKTNWKDARPTSLPNAMEMCLRFAREKHNRSVDNVADLMGLPNQWRLYKWVEEANLPARYIRAFEFSCGIDFVTRYLAHSAHRLLIDIPAGKQVAAADVHALQEMTNGAVGVLIQFAAGKASAAEVIAATTAAMEGLAWHRANAEKHEEPELDLGGGHGC